MTYNRYVPGADGAYRRETIVQPDSRCETPENTVLRSEPQRGMHLPMLQSLETEDLLVLAVLILLLLSGDESDRLTTLITIAAFLLLQ
ncbi:MAG: hypothetical protein IJS31_06860 [Oscillospiraceae bacterium]|nr:hypothetical protein [Oscillospiraceae bacterium]